MKKIQLKVGDIVFYDRSPFAIHDSFSGNIRLIKIIGRDGKHLYNARDLILDNKYKNIITDWIIAKAGKSICFLVEKYTKV